MKRWQRRCSKKELIGLSHPPTPQSNGLAERMNRTLLNKTRGLLKGASMDKGYWGEALRYATYVFNRTSTNSLQGKSPHEALLGNVPDNSQLRVLGYGANGFVHREKKAWKTWRQK